MNELEQQFHPTKVVRDELTSFRTITSKVTRCCKRTIHPTKIGLPYQENEGNNSSPDGSPLNNRPVELKRNTDWWRERWLREQNPIEAACLASAEGWEVGGTGSETGQRRRYDAVACWLDGTQFGRGRGRRLAVASEVRWKGTRRRRWEFISCGAGPGCQRPTKQLCCCDRFGCSR